VAAPAPEGGRTANNGLFLELGGNGLLYSLNYERFVSPDVPLRVGFMIFSLSARDRVTNESGSISVLAFPLTASWLGVRSGSHALELGAGVVIVSARIDVDVDESRSDFQSVEFDGTGIVGTGIIGYRYAPLNGGFNFKAAFTPFIGPGFGPWAGLSFGYLF
jgi:hypothetical protein